MNTIFDVRKKPSAGWWNTIQDRLLSMAMVFGVAFLLLVSLVISTVLSAVAGAIAGGWAALGYGLDLVISTAVVGALFAAIFKALPDVEIAWRDTVIGAAVTAVLFTLGKIALGLYLSYGSTASAYGAAGSLAALLIWIYYSSQILFIGAEFTQVYANRFGSKVVPDEDAERLGAKPFGGGRQRGGKPRATTGRAAASTSAHAPAMVHHARQATMYQMPSNGAAPASAALPALAVGAIVGGISALAGMKIKHRVRHDQLEADRVQERIDRVQNRIDSMKRMGLAANEQVVFNRLREIESRILTAAQAARRVDPMPLKNRLMQMLRQ